MNGNENCLKQFWAQGKSIWKMNFSDMCLISSKPLLFKSVMRFASVNLVFNIWKLQFIQTVNLGSLIFHRPDGIRKLAWVKLNSSLCCQTTVKTTDILIEIYPLKWNWFFETMHCPVIELIKWTKNLQRAR